MGTRVVDPMGPQILITNNVTIGPGMTYQHQHVNPAEDFPEMRHIPGIQEDYAAYLQCLVQMTQVLGNAHDLLYPSKSRSVALAKAEQYYQHIDDFAESESIQSPQCSCYCLLI